MVTVSEEIAEIFLEHVIAFEGLKERPLFDALLAKDVVLPTIFPCLLALEIQLYR